MARRSRSSVSCSRFNTTADRCGRTTSAYDSHSGSRYNARRPYSESHWRRGPGARATNLLGQMVQHQQGAIELHLFDFGVGDRSGKNRTSIRLLHIAKEALHYLAFDPAALHLRQVDFIPFPVFADEAHSVVSILLT